MSHFKGFYIWCRAIEDRIEQRLGRKTLLEDLSDTELEQLWYLARHEPANAQLEKALNEILA